MDDKVGIYILIMDISKGTFGPHFGGGIFLEGSTALHLFVVEGDLVVKRNRRFGVFPVPFIFDFTCLVVMGEYFGVSFLLWLLMHVWQFKFEYIGIIKIYS